MTAAGTASGLGKKLRSSKQIKIAKKQLKPAQKGSKRLQIGYSSGDLFDEEGFLANFGRKLALDFQKIGQKLR